MAVALVKAAQITNQDAVPITMAPANLAGGNLKASVGTVELANGDSIASIYRTNRVPSTAVITAVTYYCDAITSGAGDIGVYQTLANGSAVVDVDFFASAVSIATAITIGSSVQHEADATDAGAGYGLADVEKQLWSGLGLTVDSGRDYDIALTLTAATTAAGTFAMRVTYTSNQ